MKFVQMLFVFLLSLIFTGSFFWSFVLTLVIVFLIENKSNLQTNRRTTFTVKSKFFAGELTSPDYFILVTFYVLGNLSKAKGRVTKEDIQYANDLMRQFNVDGNNKQILINVFEQGKNNQFNLKDVINEFCQVFKNHPSTYDYFFDYQLQSVMVDGRIDNEELAILQIIANSMNMSQLKFKQKINMAQASYQFKQSYYRQQQAYGNRNYHYNYTNQQRQENYSGHRSYNQNYYQQRNEKSALKNAYEIIGVKESDDFATVKKAYRQLIKQYHPDKFSAKNVPEAVLNQAKEKSQEIIGAYNLICKEKGWK